MSKNFEDLKKELIMKRVKDTFKIPIHFLIKEYEGKGYMTDDLRQRLKLLYNECWCGVKK